MRNDDFEPLLRGRAEGLEREVLASGRKDAPSEEAKERMLAALELRSSASATQARTARLGWLGERYVHGIGLAVIVGLSAVTWMKERTERATSSMAGGASLFERPTSPEPRANATPTKPLGDSLLSVPVESLSAPPVGTDVMSPAAPAAGDAPVKSSSKLDARGGAPSRLRLAPAGEPPDTSAGSSTTSSKHAEAPAASIAVESTLGREIARVGAARSALARGQAAYALQVLDSYDAEFPSGVFSVEVAVLRIEALTRSGRAGEASRLGQHFLVDHPEGAFAHRVRVTLRGVSQDAHDPSLESPQD